MKSNIFSVTGVFVLLLSTTTLTACKKEGCMDESAINYDKKAKKDDGSCEYKEDEVSFNIISPAEAAVYYLGDTVKVEATVSSTGELHGYKVVIRNISHGDAEVFTIENEDHSNPLTINGMWINNVADHSDMEMEITVGTDHEGSTVSQHVHFHCMPM